MATKTRIAVITAAILMIFALGTMGVYAATNVSMSGSNGNVEFNSVGVYADIVGTIDATEKYNQKNYTADKTQSSAATFTNWVLGQQNLTEDKTSVVYTLTITNQSDFPAAVALTYTNGSHAAFNIALSCDQTEIAGVVTLAKGASVTYTVSVTLVDFQNSANVAISFALGMQRA